MAAEDATETRSFSQGAGRWLGAAEVYDGAGRFKGNGQDTRHVQRDVEEGTVEVDVSFIGPFKMAGTYTIADRGRHRLYQGPVNLGFAETLADNLIDANAYWPDTGLSQRFFLMVLPGGDQQLSLGLMSRGERLHYVVVGEYHRVDEDSTQSGLPAFVSGTEHDLGSDPTGGRGRILLHRPGTWSGELSLLDPDLNDTGATAYVESVAGGPEGLHTTITGTGFAADGGYALKTDGWDAWTPTGDVVGSYNMSGGRALAGHILYHREELRVWRREVVSHDGTVKAVVHTWYRGGERLGTAHGVLTFSPDQ